ncbi:MAG: TonB-dependent receptor domain-containing protein, partial [Bryobacteraceae bacterium]
HWQQRWNGSGFFVKQQYYRNIAAAEARGDTALASELRGQDKQTSGRSNNWATAVGGPVRIPGLYNGKDKLFFFFSYNGFKDVKSEDTNSINRTIPTLANRQGDFSQLLNVDAVRYAIHDPVSVREDPARATHYIRTPFPGNLIPRSRFINPIYDAYAKLLPTPNNDPANPRNEPRNNYLAIATPYNWDYKAYSSRIDYNLSEKHRFFGRWSWNDFLEDRGDWTYESARGLHSNGLNRHNIGATADWVYTMSGSTVFDFAVAANEFREGDKITTPLQFKPSSVGLPAYLDQKAGDKHILPFLDFDGYQDIGRGGIPTFTRYRILSGKADVSHVRGNHSLRSGVDVRQHFNTGGGGGNTSGNFRFTNTYTRRNDDGFTPAGDYGHNWAAFILGVPNGLTISDNDTRAVHNPYYAWFVQDNWRLTPKLTLNAGLRLEYEKGPTERYNRMLHSFDETARLPIGELAQAAYARSPIAELAAANFVVLGGSPYAGVNGVPRNSTRNELNWLPRLGVSYQIDSKIVLRGGYGMYFDTLNVLNRSDALAGYPDQTGFSRTTSTLVTTDFGVNWLAGAPQNGVSSLRDPFPIRANGTRYDVPTRDGLGT